MRKEKGIVTQTGSTSVSGKPSIVGIFFSQSEPPVLCNLSHTVAVSQLF